MLGFLKTINYASYNEDGVSELRALQIRPLDTILCITGSGARTLDLLTARPAAIVSIDFNPHQNYLLELKTAAIRYLDYEDFLAFLGITPTQERARTYTDLRPSLSPEVQRFWDHHLKDIEHGVIYRGRWEKYFRRLARLVHWLPPRRLARLFACDDLEEQARLWAEAWDGALWWALLSLVSFRVFWRYGLGDPGFYEQVPKDFSIHRYLRERFRHASTHFLFKESAFVTLLFQGRFKPDGPLPIHLQPQHYSTLRDMLSRIETVTCSLEDFLAASGRRQFDKYSLSDFASYTNPAAYARIWQGVVQTAHPGARICERQFLVKRPIPAFAQSHLVRFDDLETELTETDTSIFYTFVVATLKGGAHG